MEKCDNCLKLVAKWELQPSPWETGEQLCTSCELDAGCEVWEYLTRNDYSCLNGCCTCCGCFCQD